MANDFDISRLPPGVLEQLMGLGALDDKDALLNEQMAQAQALQQSTSGKYSTAAGAALGGLGDALKAGRGALMGREARTKRGENADARTKGRMSFADLLRQGQAQGGANSPSVTPATLLGYAQDEGARPSSYGYTPGLFDPSLYWRK